MSLINIMSSIFFDNDNKSLTVLISTLVLTKLEVSNLIEKCEEISINSITEQIIRLNYNNGYFKSKKINHNEINVNILCGMDIVSYKKINVSINSYYKEFTTMITETNFEECDDNNVVDNIVLNHKLSYNLKNYPDWNLNINLIKKITNPQEFSTRLQEYKNNLLKDYKDIKTELEESSYDMIQIILQFNSKTLYTEKINEIIQYVYKLVSMDNVDVYQNMIYSLANDIYRNHVIISRFKQKSGFKQLISNAVELSRTIYFKEILPIIDTFYITDKIDGTRAILKIVEYKKRSGRNKGLLGTDIIVISNEIKYIQKYNEAINPKWIDVSKTILDTELIIEDEKYIFNVFDVIMINNKKVSNLPFKLRFKEFKLVDNILNHYNLGKTKEFIKLTKNDYKEQIESFYKKSLESNYEIDGIIFTPEGIYYKDVKQEKTSYKDRSLIINTEYYNTISYKWKPVEQSTIDFYMMYIEPEQAKKLRKNAGMITNTSEHLYALCSGVDIITFNKLNLSFFEGYKAPESENSYQYFPIQFSPYDNPFIYLWSSSDNTLNNRVGEFKFVDKNGHLLTKPELIRMRDDRSNDIKKGEYFGNALKYAELIWHSIKHPLTFEMLGSSNEDITGYFASNSGDDFFAQRAFNSYVKTELVKNYLNTPSIIDLMSGKGQDLARVINLGFNEITLVDRDIDALYELLQRKYNLRLKTKDSSATIHIREIDFENAYEDIIDKIDLQINIESAMCNFGIHYLCHDKTEHNKNLPINDLFRLVNYVLKSKGRFLITCFNGLEIFNLLKDKEQWMSQNKKYSIKKAYSSNTFTDLNQAIDILLPFSNNNYYREYLVNFKFIESVANKNGFTLIENKSFSTMLKEFKKSNIKIYNDLTEEDIDYVSLYSYMILEKN